MYLASDFTRGLLGSVGALFVAATLVAAAIMPAMSGLAV